MVWPGWVGHVHFSGRICDFDQLKRLTHGTRATRSGHRRDGVARDALAQDQANHRIRIGGVARQSHIALAFLCLHQTALCFFHSPHNRRHALCVFVDANAQIHFGRTRIFAIGRHQGQDFVCRLCFEVAQHYASPVAIGTVGKAPHSVQDPS